MRFDVWRVGTVCSVWLLITENRKILTQKKDPDSKHSHRHLWRLVLLLLVALPLLPEIMIYAIAALAKIKGCNVDDAKVCFIAGTQGTQPNKTYVLSADFGAGQGQYASDGSYVPAAERDGPGAQLTAVKTHRVAGRPAVHKGNTIRTAKS